MQAKRREIQELKLPSNSVKKLLIALKRIATVRAQTRAKWVVEPLTKKAQDMLELLNLPKPPMTFKSIQNYGTGARDKKLANAGLVWGCAGIVVRVDGLEPSRR